ncbi:MAG: transglycosylase domain-containing protein [Steroidobacteraceae bacterium]
MKRRRVCWVGAMLGLAAVVLAVATVRDLAALPSTLPPPRQGLQPVLLASDGTPLTIDRAGRFNRTEQLPLTQIPQLLRTAFVFSEDRRYWTHGGSDWRARFAALWQNLRAGHIVRGASTIGEQAARILTPRPRTYWSHWLEGLEAGRLIGRFGHAGVLDFYLNQVPYGAERRGVAQAAHFYFGAQVGALDPAEQLALVVLVRSPTALSPRHHPRALRRVIDSLAERMRRKGLLGPGVLQAILRSPLAAVAPAQLPVIAGGFVGFVRARIRALHLRGRHFTTTLDAPLERFVQRTLTRRVDDLAPRGVRNGAALVVDNRRGTVLAWAAAPPVTAGDLDPVRIPRQPGSTLKPFLYSLAMERLGWQPSTVLRDGPLSVRIGHGVHVYRNYSNRFYGKVSLRYALGNSLNIPAVETAQTVGVARFIHLLVRLGITTLRRPAAYYGPAVAIGDGPVSLYQLVQAYATLARRGRFMPLRVLRDAPRVRPERVLSSAVTSVIATILSDPDARSAEFGPYSVLDLPFPTAVKTGTSSDFHDALAVGFDNRYTVGVWMGRLSGGNMQTITGAAGPAPVLRAIFAYLRQREPYAGLWRSPELRRVHVCERIGPGPCIHREDWRLPSEAHRVAVVPSRRALAIARPVHGERLAIDPRIPRVDQVYTFRIAGGPAVRSVTWILDGRMLGRTDRRRIGWVLAPGRHQLSARVRLGGGAAAVRLGPVPFIVE